MKKKKEKLSKIFMMISGVMIGVINGFFGGGGGMLCVPILEKVFKMKTKNAHSTALLVMLPLSIVSGVIYLLNKNVDMFTLGLVGIGTLIGGVLGTFVIKKINSNVLSIIFALIMLAAGIRMVIPWVLP